MVRLFTWTPIIHCSPCTEGEREEEKKCSEFSSQVYVVRCSTYYQIIATTCRLVASVGGNLPVRTQSWSILFIQTHIVPVHTGNYIMLLDTCNRKWYYIWHSMEKYPPRFIFFL